MGRTGLGVSLYWMNMGCGAVGPCNGRAGSGGTGLGILPLWWASEHFCHGSPLMWVTMRPLCNRSKVPTGASPSASPATYVLPISSPGATMDSLLFLCARRLVRHESDFRRALAILPSELYPVLFSAAFLDRRTLVVRDLVAVWPFPVLSFQRVLAHLDRHLLHCPKGSPRNLCVEATIMAIVAHLRQTLEDPDRGMRWVPNSCQDEQEPFSSS